MRQGREVNEGISSLQACIIVRQGSSACTKRCPCSSRAIACTPRWCTRDTTGSTITTWWVTSSYTFLIDNVCTLHNILYLLTGDHSIQKSILWGITLYILIKIMIPLSLHDFSVLLYIPVRFLARVNHFKIFTFSPVAMSQCLSVCLCVVPFSCTRFWGLFCPHFPRLNV